MAKSPERAGPAGLRSWPRSVRSLEPDIPMLRAPRRVAGVARLVGVSPSERLCRIEDRAELARAPAHIVEHQSGHVRRKLVALPSDLVCDRVRIVRHCGFDRAKNEERRPELVVGHVGGRHGMTRCPRHVLCRPGGLASRRMRREGGLTSYEHADFARRPPSCGHDRGRWAIVAGPSGREEVQGRARRNRQPTQPGGGATRRRASRPCGSSQTADPFARRSLPRHSWGQCR